MRTRMAAIGASVALAIGGLAACSSGSHDVVRSDSGGGAATASDPAEALKQATQKTTQAGTAKVSMTFTLTGVPGIGDTTLAIDGALDSTTGQSSFTLDLSKLAAALPAGQQAGVGAILGNGTMQIVTDGGDVYLQLGSLSTILGATTGQSWIKVPVGSDAAGAVGAPLGDGTEILKLLDQAGGLKVVGTEQVRGTDTTHYQGTLDLASALAEASADQRAKAESELGKVGIDPSSASLPVDVWISADGLVRRVQIGVQGLQATGSAPAIGWPRRHAHDGVLRLRPAGHDHRAVARPGARDRPVDAREPRQPRRRLRPDGTRTAERPPRAPTGATSGRRVPSAHGIVRAERVGAASVRVAAVRRRAERAPALFERSESAAKRRRKSVRCRRSAATCRASTDCSSGASRRRGGAASVGVSPQCGDVPSEHRLFERSESAPKRRRGSRHDQHRHG